MQMLCSAAVGKSQCIMRQWTCNTSMSQHFLPCDVCQQEVNLAGQLRVGNGDCWSLCCHCEVSCAPFLDISGQDKLEV